MSESTERGNTINLRVPCFNASDFHVRITERECIILFSRSAFSLDQGSPRLVEPVFAFNCSPQAGKELSGLLASAFDDFESKKAASLKLFADGSEANFTRPIQASVASSDQCGMTGSLTQGNAQNTATLGLESQKSASYSPYEADELNTVS